MRALAALALLLAALAAGAPAQAAGIDKCEAIKDADAYNRCLASYGPARRDLRVKAVPADADRPRGRGRAARATTSPRSSGGKARMEFSVSPRGKR